MADPLFELQSIRLDDIASIIVAFLGSPILWFLQIQSCLTCLGLSACWWYASWSRRKAMAEIEAEQAKGNAMAFITTDSDNLSSSKQKDLPMVSVILAVKGVGEQGMVNWRSQLVTLYGGAVEFLFCMESKQDPAYDAVSALKKEMSGTVEIRLVVAGLSSHCSQQIHNQLAGAKSADPRSKYILFLDDDIQCHPGTIGSLVDTMEKRPDVFVATGYSFDVPSQPSLGAYAAMAYRLPLLVGMSSGARVFFIWGGCIFFRTADLRENKHGMKTALEQNGYSNDLILTSIAGVNKRAVWSPAVAIFPGKMSGDWNLTRYWNYVRRQIFALLTYCSSYAYRVNRFGWIVYMYLAWACVLPLLLATVQICAVVLALAWSLVSFLDSPSGLPLFETAMLSARSVSPSAVSFALSAANLLCCSVLILSGANLFSAVLGLCNKLSPEASQKFSLGKISLGLSVAGMALNLLMLPIIALYTYLRADISWARIRYVRKNGVVAKVTHPGEEEDVGLRETQQLPGGTVLVAKILAILHQGSQGVGSFQGVAQVLFDYVVKHWSQRMRRTKVG